jgi:SH3-like domain-containing protein
MTALTSVTPAKRTRRSQKKAEPSGGAASTALSVDGPPVPIAAGAKGASRPPRAFDRPPLKGVERAAISYRRVRISSEPDAVRSTELGRLDRGDEVEILDSREGFLYIRTPDGVTGWILRHTTVGGPA